ncbi:MAG: hypothetical protein IJ638_01470 [Alphaproteobacteria bacterium]|nr:hypothetical protein [Alphaproteobacteria bacterium]
MKKFILFLMLAVFISGPSMAQRRRTTYRRSKTNAVETFRFTDDMVKRIKNHCPNVLKNAPKKSENLEAYCSVRDLHFGEADLGPWKKFVQRAEKIFLQFRRLIYVAAVFMILWILVKASYEGDMKWMHIAMLVIGVIILAFAEVLLDLATNRVSLEDVISNGVYVDCRDKKVEDAYYKCNTSDDGAALYDSRYFLQVSGEVKTGKAKVYDGLY